MPKISGIKIYPDYRGKNIFQKLKNKAFKKIFKFVGGINENFHYLMDTELWHRFAKYGFKYERLDHFVWALRLHSLAKTSAHNFTVNHPSLALINNEAEQIRLLYFPDFCLFHLI